MNKAENEQCIGEIVANNWILQSLSSAVHQYCDQFATLGSSRENRI